MSPLQLYPCRLAVRPSRIDRLGCFTEDPLPEGVAVIEYTGERIDLAEAERREADPGRVNWYIFSVDDETFIDGHVGGNESRFVNHSCEPNIHCERVDGRVFYTTAREIAAGEELTIDYAYGPDVDPAPCSCGAPGCRGFLNEIPPT